MGRVKLEDYGRIFRSYTGQGEIVSADGRSHSLTVAAGVTHGAKVVLVFEGPGHLDLDPEPPTPTVVSLADCKVELTGFRTVYATTHFQVGEIVTSQVSCLASSLVIGDREAGADEVQYHVSNLKLVRPLTWILGDGYSVKLQPVVGHSEEIRQLDASGGMVITATIHVSRVDKQPLQLDAVDDMMNDLCLLLSLARGTTVNWISSEWSLRGCAGSYHRNIHVSNYGNIDVIPSYPPEDLQQFVGRCYPAYRRIAAEWGMDLAIRQFVNSIQGGYIQLRALNLTTLLDYLTGQYSRAFDDGGFLVQPDVFKSRKKQLQEQVKAVLRERFADLPRETTGEMSQHVSGFHRRSFKSSLERMLAHLRLRVNPEELSRFVAIRNRLVHEANLLPHDTGGSSWTQFSLVLSVVSRVLLAILRYEGYYYDWTRHVPGEWQSREMTGRILLPIEPPEATRE